jgi:hypothetical protein
MIITQAGNLHGSIPGKYREGFGLIIISYCKSWQEIVYGAFRHCLCVIGIEIGGKKQIRNSVDE